MADKRLYQVLGSCLLGGLAGILYGLFVRKTGLGIPCMFHLLTGLKCPGCGVTRMAVALLQLDFAGAFEANPAVLVLSPVLLAVFIKSAKTYIRTGRWTMGAMENTAVWLGTAVLVLYGIVRNVLPLP